MALSAVLFDLDYTLAVPNRDRQTLLDEATAAAGVGPIDRSAYLDAHATGRATETRTPLFETLVEDGDPEAVAGAYRAAVEDALVPVPGAAELVADLRERYRVGLLTDGPSRAQRGKLEALGWTDSFDAVVVTGELGTAKPDPRAFAEALDRLGADPSEAVHVGDHPEADVRGAREAGLAAVQVLTNRFERVAADAHVDRDGLGPQLRAVLAARSG
jgi:putative hydrolase of the HAD superfamily